MTGTLEYIEKYFAGNLSEEEKSAFERKCETEPEFAKQVGFYIVVQDNIRKELYDQKKKAFDELYTQLSSSPQHAPRSFTSHPLFKQLRPYLAPVAVCLLLFIGWLALFNNPSPQQLASSYVEKHLHTLAITMSGHQDSLQLGIAAFNKKNYPLAERIFRSLASQHTLPLAPEATKNLGILYLVTGQYDKALVAFDSLAAKNLHANPGPFYKAVTLMQRSKGRDREEARIILQEIIDKRLPGNKVAEEWIKEW